MDYGKVMMLGIIGIELQKTPYPVMALLQFQLNGHIVDDGAATGATIIVAARSIKRRFKLKRLIIALPVAPKDIVKLLKQEADLVEVVTSPSNFHAVGQYYHKFEAIEDADVIEIRKQARVKY
jgi:predicted phosphoribosyltransferase